MRKLLWLRMRIILTILLSVAILTQSTLYLNDPVEKVRSFTRNLEFDYINWTVESLFKKNQYAAIKPEQYIGQEDGQEILERYFRQVDEIDQLRSQIASIYADPNIPDPERTAEEFSTQLEQMEKDNNQLAALSEALLQQQISQVVADLNLSLDGQLFPPLVYRVTPLPMALIVSPREIIRQDVDLSLQASLSLEEIVDLEEAIDDALDVSTLVVNIGGVGIYPTMVLRTTNLAWMIETVAHEWIHNYLTLRPLGMLYAETPQLRTMNETTASLAGKEIALAVYERFYPQFLPKEPELGSQIPTGISEEPEFDFRAEMHETRITADQLLAEGKIQEAEDYMEARRVTFWNNGYRIRKLNQAYFAFYGAYADEPGGSAGTDPVGPAVVRLRERSSSLAEFLNRIAWMTSFDNLIDSLEDQNS